MSIVVNSLGIGWDGRRHLLSVELAIRESASSWTDHLVHLKNAASTACLSATITPA